MTTLRDFYHQITASFTNGVIEAPAREAKVLIREMIGIGEEGFIANPDQELTEQQKEVLGQAAERRLSGEPISKIAGVREFWGLEFLVTRDTLDPRPDTETLIEAVLKWVQKEGLQDKPLRILDLGTGTGCIAISLLVELPSATAIAVDYSLEAVSVALQNTEKHKMRDRLTVIQGDWMEAFQPGSFDLIVSNPPYIPNLDIENLSIQVKNHDPILALAGGNSGLECYKKIISSLKIHLNHSSRTFLEIGIHQLESITRLVDDSTLCVCDSHLDMLGIPRVVEISRGDK